MAKNPQFHGHTKHIEIKYHFIRELVSNGVVQLKYCPTEEMTADMLTKGLSHDQFVKLQAQLQVRRSVGKKKILTTVYYHTFSYHMTSSIVFVHIALSYH